MDTYQNLGEVYFTEALQKVERRLTEYGITVTYSKKIPEFSVAEFDGLNIELSPKLSSEAALFVLLHLFGHIADYCSENGYQLDQEATLDEHRESERTASQYGLQLLYELRITELDQWLSDIWHWDWEYIEGVYGRNEPTQPSFCFDYSEIPYGRPLLLPKPVPPFRLRRLEKKTVI